jgi:hypothetical protein
VNDDHGGRRPNKPIEFAKILTSKLATCQFSKNRNK